MKSLILSAALIAGVALSAATDTVPAPPAVPADAGITHVLNRIAFGPRPGDVDAVKAMGLQAYIDQQLHPERIADSGLPARLTGLTSVTMSSRQIADQFEQPLLDARRDRKQDRAG